MITILEVLKGINAYPIPQRTIGEIAIKRSLNLDADLTSDIAVSKGFLLAKADLYMWLSFAPDVSQGGQSYSFSEDQRTSFRNLYTATSEKLRELLKLNLDTREIPYDY